MIPLLDVNLLVALAWPNHVHHRLAHTWFRAVHADGWATCPITQSGFVRVSSNRAVVSDAVTPLDAILLLREMIDQPGHVFWSDEVSIARSDTFAAERIAGHRQVTDAHLLALAAQHGGRLATLDRRIAGLVPNGTDPEDALILVQD